MFTILVLIKDITWVNNKKGIHLPDYFVPSKMNFILPD